MRPTSPTRGEYEKRLNRVLEFIAGHLQEDIRLDKLAEVACFSPYHFHRIFAALVGEPPAEFVRRLRLERAANLLLNDPLSSVTEIALGCGFSSSALFARLFRERFGQSPTEWRERRSARSGPAGKKRQMMSKNGLSNSKPRKAADLWLVYNRTGTQTKRRSAMRDEFKNIRVEVKDVPAMRLAYVKHLKGYEDGPGIEGAFQKLFMWAGPRGFLGGGMKVLGMSLDNPGITPKDKCRYYACVEVSAEAQPQGEVGIMETHAGRYAVAGFKGSNDVFRRAYDFLFGSWLPHSGFQPDDHPCFEVYTGEPQGGKNPVFEFDLYIPVKPL
jgi:AraC family transcriptional regulator